MIYTQPCWYVRFPAPNHQAKPASLGKKNWHLPRKFVQPGFGVCMSMWGTFFCIFWRRRCAWLSHIWGNGWIEAPGMGWGLGRPIWDVSHLFALSFFIIFLGDTHSTTFCIPCFWWLFLHPKLLRCNLYTPSWFFTLYHAYIPFNPTMFRSISYLIPLLVGICMSLLVILSMD